jgi:hypothetical protein
MLSSELTQRLIEQFASAPPAQTGADDSIAVLCTGDAGANASNKQAPVLRGIPGGETHFTRGLTGLVGAAGIYLCE